MVAVTFTYVSRIVTAGEDSGEDSGDEGERIGKEDDEDGEEGEATESSVSMLVISMTSSQRFHRLKTVALHLSLS